MKKAIRSEMVKKKRINTPLEFALKLEQKGVSLYMKLAVETENPLGKKLFYSLAGEEIDQARKVDEITLSLQKNNELKVIMDKRSLPSVEDELKGFMNGLKTEGTENGSQNASGYKLAMKLEKESYKLYSRLFANAHSQTEKSFYKELMNQENSHLEAIVNVYSYLTNTDDWLREEESRVWNWMNI